MDSYLLTNVDLVCERCLCLVTVDHTTFGVELGLSTLPLVAGENETTDQDEANDSEHKDPNPRDRGAWRIWRIRLKWINALRKLLSTDV